MNEIRECTDDNREKDDAGSHTDPDSGIKGAGHEEVLREELQTPDALEVAL